MPLAEQIIDVLQLAVLAAIWWKLARPLPSLHVCPPTKQVPPCDDNE